MSFNFTNSPDRALYEQTLSESIDIFGIDIEYWVVEFDDNKDNLYREDTKPIITERHIMKAQAEYLVTEDFLLTKFGLQSNDIFEIIISKSKFEEIVGEGAEPKSGDKVKILYHDRIFTVAEAKEEDNIFLQQKFSWKLILNPANHDGIEVTDEIGVPNIEIEEPLFDDTDLIEALDDDIVVEKDGDVSPFGEWG